jgi:hypothetical protein
MNLNNQTSSVDRRRFLEYTWRGVGASLSLALVPADALIGAPRFRVNPFTLGVASGDLRFMTSVENPNGTGYTQGSWVVEDGEPGAREA